MKKSKNLIFFLVVLLSSCVYKHECNIKPITSDEFNPNQYNGDFIFENDKKELDTLLLVNYINILTDKTVKSFTNYQKCGHLIEMNYEFRKTNGTLEIRLEKDENENFIFKIGGLCIDKEFVLNKNDIRSDSILIVKIDPCNYTKIKEIAFKRLSIIYVKTLSDDMWLPKEFIPKLLKIY